MKNLLIAVITSLLPIVLCGQQVAKSSQGSFLLKNGTLVTVTQGNLKADLLIKDGKIARIGNGITTDAETQTIDCTDKYVYPGFIDGGCNLGLSEVGSVSLTQDFNELGDFTPHMQALTAVNPNAVAIPVTRVNGITTVFTKPSGGKFPGTGVLINLHGYTPEQMHAGFKGVLLNFPSSGKRNRWDRRSAEDIKKENEKSNKELNEIWGKAILYAKIDSAAKVSNKSKQGYNPGMDAIISVVNGEAPIMIEVNKASDIKSAITWAKKQKLNVILTGVADGWKVKDEIKASGYPVITGPVLATPSRPSDKYDTPYSNASQMSKAGIKVAIRTNDTENVRNLPYQAGFAATYGMGTEEALKAITINPAEIFGVSDQYGSLEEGKMASLFISDGDPFETKTSIQGLFINGWMIPLESRHTLLYKEFLERNPGLKSN